MDQSLEPLSDRETAQIRKGLIEFCVLLAIGKGEAYASDIIRTLKDVRLLVVEGTLYPLLSRLRREGYLEYTWAESQAGPPRKYYRLTRSGLDNLEVTKKVWQELSTSINNLIEQQP